MNQKELDEFVRFIFKETYLMYTNYKTVATEKEWQVLAKQVEILGNKYAHCPLVVNICIDLVEMIEIRNAL